MRKGLFLTVLLVAGHALIATPQEASIGTLDRDKVTAGEKFHLNVKLSVAPNYGNGADATFDYKASPGLPALVDPLQIYCSGNTTAGSRDLDMSCAVPLDADGGIYKLRDQQMRLMPPTGVSRQRYLKLQALEIEVVPIPDKNVYPTAADATISLDQRQILKNGGFNVEYLLDQLDTRVDENTTETKELRAYLVTVAVAGREQLQKVRAQYQESQAKGKTEPIFFEDFDRQFEAFIVRTKLTQNPKTKPF